MPSAIAPPERSLSGWIRSTGWQRPRPSARGVWTDAAIGVVAALLTVLGMELALARARIPRDAVDDPLTMVLGVLVALPLCIRRVLPTTSMTTSMTAYMALGYYDQAASSSAPAIAAVFACMTAATAWARRRRLLVAGWVFVALQLIVLLVVTARSNPDVALESVAQGLAANGVYFGGAFFVGHAMYRAAATSERMERTAAALLEEQELNARQSALAERLRIAREVHDVASQHISVSGVQAAAARRVLQKDPEAAEEAMRVVEESSRSAVTEMRDLLGVLRAPGTETGPVDPAGHVVAAEPGRRACVEALPDLVESTRQTGLAATLEVVGRPVDLPASTSSSLFRLVQEALANVRKHSTADHAHVAVRWPDGDATRPGERPCVEVEVLDDGTARGGTSGSQLGHVGMRERAELAGAHLEIGPRPLGGYRVLARYPVHPHEPPTVEPAGGRAEPETLEAHP